MYPPGELRDEALARPRLPQSGMRLTRSPVSRRSSPCGGPRRGIEGIRLIGEQVLEGRRVPIFRVPPGLGWAGQRMGSATAENARIDSTRPATGGTCATVPNVRRLEGKGFRTATPGQTVVGGWSTRGFVARNGLSCNILQIHHVKDPGSGAHGAVRRQNLMELPPARWYPACMHKRSSIRKAGPIKALADEPADHLGAASTSSEVPPQVQKNLAAVELGRLGGKKGGPARAASLSVGRRSEIARQAANARWKKLEASGDKRE